VLSLKIFILLILDFWVILEYWWVCGVLEVFLDENELKNLNPTSLFFWSPQ
jgi:hypothetical protein